MKMELEDLMKLMKAFGASNLSELKYSDGTETVRLRRERTPEPGKMPVMEGRDARIPTPAGIQVMAANAAAPAMSGNGSLPAAVAPGTSEKKAAQNTTTSEEKGTVVKVPLAGIFYRASKPGAKPYAEEGKPVKKGETVGLIEAMKMMSEIPSPCDGVVREFRIGDGEFAEYGRTLLIIDGKA